MNGFGRREFQLVLLRRMADYQPGLVTAAARSLDASRTEMRKVNARWQRILRSSRFPGGERRLRLVLGAPERRVPRSAGDVTCQASWWTLPLWPDLRFEAVAAPDGTLLQEWLVRPDGAPSPALGSAADLAPWSCVVGDVARCFAPVDHRADMLPSRWQSVFSTPEGSYVAHFVWGLLQVVEEQQAATGRGRTTRTPSLRRDGTSGR